MTDMRVPHSDLSTKFVILQIHEMHTFKYLILISFIQTSPPMYLKLKSFFYRKNFFPNILSFLFSLPNVPVHFTMTIQK